jgi:hypothetical protein
VSKHEDVLRDERKRIEQTLADPLQRILLDDEAIPRCERVRDAIDAVLAKVESLRAERRSLSCSLSNVEDELKQAGMGCVGPTYLRVLKLRQRAERLEKALRRMMVVDDVLQGFDAYAQIQSGKGGGMGGNILTEQQGRFFSRSYWERVRRALAEAREALAPSAPEPAPAEPWVQCTDHMNLAKPRCLGGCRTRAEHERYTAKPEPAPAPTEPEVIIYSNVPSNTASAKPYAELRARMSPEAQAEAKRRADEILAVMPAPTERVCRCAASAVAVCAQYVEGDTGYWCGNCFHDRACHTGEQR